MDKNHSGHFRIEVLNIRALRPTGRNRFARTTEKATIRGPVAGKRTYMGAIFGTLEREAGMY